MDTGAQIKKRGIAGKIAAFFIHNLPIAWIFFMGSIVFGIIAYHITPKQYNPTILLPAFQIDVAYPGATASDVETLVLEELEEKIFDIPGVDTVRSQAIDGGMARVTVLFDVGEDIEASKVKLSSKLSDHTAYIQGNISEPTIMRIDPDTVPILTYGFSKDGIDQHDMRAEVVALAQRLKTIDGVANINVHGGSAKQLRVMLDPQLLEEQGISTLEVQQAIEDANNRIRVGATQTGVTRQYLVVDGRLHAQEDLARLTIKPDVQLADIAQVVEDFEEPTSYIWASDTSRPYKDMVFLSIAKKDGENALDVADRVTAFFADDSFVQSVEPQLFRDEAQVAREAIGGLGKNLMTSILIVSLVLLAFLGKKSAGTVAMAIPLTLAWVFVVGMLFGKNINRITLFALILSLGLLVDSATVVIENISRHVKMGKPLHDAIIDAVDEVGMGLFLSTITSVIVFLPTSQISGMMGAYMGPLSFFVPMALIMSLVIAYTLIPFLSLLLLKNGIANFPGSDKRSLFDTVANKYEQWLGNMFLSKAKQTVFLGTVFLTFLAVLLFPVLQIVHFKMLPSADKEQYYLYVNAGERSDIDNTKHIVEDIEQFLLAQPDTESVQSFVADAPVVDFNGLFKGAYGRVAPYLATMRVNITHPDDRKKRSPDIVAETRALLAADETLASYINNGVSIRFVEDPPGPPVEATMVAKVVGQDTAMRDTLQLYIADTFRTIDSVVDVETSAAQPVIERQYRINRDKAHAAGVSVQSVIHALRVGFSGHIVGQYYNDGNEISTIGLYVDPSFRDSIDDVSYYTIKNNQGEMVPVVSVLEDSDTQQADIIIHDDAAPTALVSAELANRSVVYSTIDAYKQLLDREHLAEIGLTRTGWNLFGIQYEDTHGQAYDVVWGGEWEMTVENFRDLGVAMLIAFVCIYIVLVAQFRSFRIPALIMVTIPLGLLGILPGFAVLDHVGVFLTATSLIGFIALMGIVVNNAILYVEYVMQQEEEGMPYEQALREAGKTRLRPILLTSMTTVLGSLTIIGDPVWSGLAWAIIFGLSLSAVLTLGVFPLLLLRTRKEE